MKEAPRGEDYQFQFGDALSKAFPPHMRREFACATVMMVAETVHDANLVPGQYGLSRDLVGEVFVPDNPVVRWCLGNIGDMFEIGAGFITMRLGFVALNETLKRIPAAKGYQIPDEACFWISLLTPATIKSIHSLGLISLFGIHDHMDQPVPGMLFGQAFAMAVLVGSHYASRRKGLRPSAVKTVQVG